MSFCKLATCTALLALAACSQDNGTDAGAGASQELAADSADTDRVADPAPSPAPAVDAAPEADAVEEPGAFARTMPVALIGIWRETDGPAPTAAQCDNYTQANMGKVLTIREDGYSYFETGGRLLTVSDRTPGMIRADFDTTYADEQTRDEMTFRVDPVARTLTSTHHGGNAQTTRTYKRCP